MDLQDIKEKLVGSYNISKSQMGEILSKTKDLTERVQFWDKQDPVKKQRDINEFLFTPDKLPAFGKEYWFFLLTGNKANHKDQLMISFGRNKGNSLEIDGNKQLEDTMEYLGGIGEIWYYHKGKTVKFGKLGGKIIAQANIVSFSTEEYVAVFAGEYPNFSLRITKLNEEIVTIETRMPEIGDSIEYFYIDKVNMGVEVGNVYLDYTGLIDGEFFSGRAYMQKVMMSAPFIPWYWGRFIFENGAVIVFFLLWIELPGISRTIYSQGKFYDVSTQSYHKFDNFEIKSVKNTDYWILTHDSKELNVFILMESYAKNVFVMRSKGEFRYDERFAEIKEIKIRRADNIYDSITMGKSSGSLEIATGFAF